MSFLAPNVTDIAGFVSAQDEMRSSLGVAVNFGVPQTPQWPTGVAINPDTGFPYDATAVQSNAEYLFTEVTCLIIEKRGVPLRPQGSQFNGPSGVRDGIDVVLDVGTADYETTVADATYFTVAGLNYMVEEGKPFTIGGTVYRWLVYGATR